MKHFIYLAMVFVYFSMVNSQQQPFPEKLPRNRTYDVFHYKLNISIDERKKTCCGDVNKQFQVWSQDAPEDNHYWFLCYDYPNDRATSEMIVTVERRFTVISNGKFLWRMENSVGNSITYHWSKSKPKFSYLISLVVGEYIYQLQRAADGVDRHQAIDELRWYAVWTLGDSTLSNIADTLIIAFRENRT